MSIEEFERDFSFYHSADNIEINRVITSSYFNDRALASKRGFELAEKEEYGVLLGTFKDIPIYNYLHTDIRLDEEQEYIIKKSKLYEVCKKCSNKKMYDEKYEKFYCPICDNTKERIKDKFFKLLR